MISMQCDREKTIREWHKDIYFVLNNLNLIIKHFQLNFCHDDDDADYDHQSRKILIIHFVIIIYSEIGNDNMLKPIKAACCICILAAQPPIYNYQPLIRQQGVIVCTI
jgi:hypothetical protein